MKDYSDEKLSCCSYISWMRKVKKKNSDKMNGSQSNQSGHLEISVFTFAMSANVCKNQTDSIILYGVSLSVVISTY